MSIEIKDENRIPSVVRELKSVKGRNVLIGWWGEIAGIAAVHEFGARVPVSQKMRNFFAALGFPLKASTKHFVIPERAPLRETADSKDAADALESVMEHSLYGVMTGTRTADQHVAAVGETMAAQVKNRITDGLDPDNHPVTMLLKGSGKPLVNHGHLVREATWKEE